MRPLALAVAVSLLACKPRDANDPKTWIGRLDDNDPKVRVQAVQQLRKLKAKQAAPQIALLLKDPLLKEDAARALEDLGGPEQVDALLAAVDTTVGAGSDTAARAANRTNFRIAEALGNIGDARAGPALLRLARSGDDNVRIAAVEALGNVKSKDAVPELSHIVDDPTAPPLLIKRAVVALGQIGDTAGIPALAHALVIERQGVSFLPDSSFALFLMGPSAVEPLMKIAQDQDPAYLAWAKENNRAPAGTYAKTALVLGDLEDQRAVPVLLAKLKYVDPDPNRETSRLLSNLVRMFAANALGRMRATQAAAAVQALVSQAAGPGPRRPGARRLRARPGRRPGCRPGPRQGRGGRAAPDPHRRDPRPRLAHRRTRRPTGIERHCRAACRTARPGAGERAVREGQ